jgi:hypothetical protein
MKSDGSQFCLRCGLCCNGVLHAYTSIHPDEVELVQTLGLTVVPRKGALGFRQPCLLYQSQRCANYLCRPSSCKEYQCALLQKYLAGEVKPDDAVKVIQRSQELFAELLRQLPAGYSFNQLQSALDQEDESGEDVFGFSEPGRVNADLLFALGKLIRYLQRHFGKPRQRGMAKVRTVSERGCA